MVMKSRKGRDIFQFVIIVGIIILLNVIGSLEFFRVDLTSEKRYSLSDATINLLESFDDVLYVKVYLEGDFPAGFQRLQRETRQMLDEFRAYNGNIEYQFINPDGSEDIQNNRELKQQLQYKGLKPYNLQIREQGGNKEREVYPGAILTYGDKEVPVLLLLDQFASSPERQVNNSIQNLEFQLANGIRALISSSKPSVAFLYGHGELE
ncbi:MAG TPA: gliding motility-associated ABC transporter substrate-binding protein GldG, partial [Cryomorphaceae bacterium]|nr:gliding motility-associated ABC transporter substrate-binding protein GldG [Cryomorphaceae bacterium]